MRSNLQIIAEHYAASDAKDIGAMLADLAPDAAWTEMQGFPYAGTYIGSQAVLDNVFLRIGADFEGFAFSLERLHDAGDTIIATGSYSGKHRGTGKSFSCRVAHLWRLAGAKIIGFEQFADTLLVAQAMR
jgi:ketosteroid isomerase-like protein